MDKKRKKVIVASISSVLVLLILLATTYAFFRPQTGSGSSKEIDTVTHTTDSLVFNIEKDIEIVAYESIFQLGGEDLFDETTATAVFRASTSKSSSAYYNFYLELSGNDFVYTTDEETPELVVEVKKNGTPVDIDSLNCDSNHVCDITGVNALLTIAKNEQISADAGEEVTDLWYVKVTFRNLDNLQNNNTGINLSGKLLLNKGREPGVEVSVVNKPVSGYLPKATVTTVNGTATYNNKYNEILISNITGDAEVKLTYNEPATKDYLREKVEGLAATTSSRTDWQVVHETFVNDSSETVDTGYRYEGKNPNNYIWFNNELWRIIGSVPVLQSDGTTITNLAKIIRNDSIGALVWHKGNTNEWANTSGNAVASLNSLLNGAYLDWETNKTSVVDYCYQYDKKIATTCNYSETGIKDEYRGMIKEVTWQLGGILTNRAPASTFYEAERGTTTYKNSRETSFAGKIGLMYPSDYGYSVLASSCERNKNLSSYAKSECSGSSWLYGQGCEWTLFYDLGASYGVFYVGSSGNTHYHYAHYGYNVRPVLYLDSSVYVVDGTGTINDPYIINM